MAGLCGPQRRSGLGCSANTSSARVKDTHSCSYSHTHAHTHCHLSTAPSLASVTAVCLSRNPTKLAGVQHQGLSPRRLGRGPGSSCELFLGTDLGSTSLVSFCLIRSPLAHPGLLFSLIPLSGTLWLLRLSFNYQRLLLSLTHTHTYIVTWIYVSLLVYLCGRKC